MFPIPEGTNLRDEISYGFGRSFRRRDDINPPEISRHSSTLSELVQSHDEDGNPDEVKNGTDGDFEEWSVGEADEALKR